MIRCNWASEITIDSMLPPSGRRTDVCIEKKATSCIKVYAASKSVVMLKQDWYTGLHARYTCI